MTGCSIPGCNNSTENGCALKILPRKNVPREKWLKSISRTNWEPDEHTYCVCEEHYKFDMAVTLCFDDKQDPKSYAVPTIQPEQKSSKTMTNTEVQSSASKSSSTSNQLQHGRIKNSKNNDTLLWSDSESESEVIEEIEYEVMDELEDDDQSSDKDLEKMLEESVDSDDQHSEKDTKKVIQVQRVNEEPINSSEPKKNTIHINLSKHSKTSIDASEKLIKNQENLTPNTDDLYKSKINRSQSQDSVSGSSENLDCDEEKSIENQLLLKLKKENSIIPCKKLPENKAKLSKTQEKDQHIKKLDNNQVSIIKKERKIAPKPVTSITPILKIHEETLHNKFNGKQENLNKNNQTLRIIDNSSANLQNKLFLIVKPEKSPLDQKILPKKSDKLDQSQTNCNITNNKLLGNQVILFNNQKNVQKPPENSQLNRTKSVGNQVILIKNPNQAQEVQNNVPQAGTNLVKNQLFFILKKDAPPHNDQNTLQTGQDKPQIKNNAAENQQKLHTDEEDLVNNKRKLRPAITSESQSNKKLCTSQDNKNLPPCSEKLTENRRKLSQYLQYLNEASKTVSEYKRNNIIKKDTSSKDNTKNIEDTSEENTLKDNTVKEKLLKEKTLQEIIFEEKNDEIDDDPFSANDPEQFTTVNESMTTPMPTYNNNNNNNNNNNKNSISSSKSDNNNDNSSNKSNNNDSNNLRLSGSDQDKINYMSKLIEKQQQLLRVYRNKLGFARYKIKDQEAKMESWKAMMGTIFNDDQISYLEAIQSQKKRCKSWSPATIKDALDIKNIIGTPGYIELLKRKYPFPALRTLREKTQKSKDDL